MNHNEVRNCDQLLQFDREYGTEQGCWKCDDQLLSIMSAFLKNLRRVGLPKCSDCQVSCFWATHHVKTHVSQSGTDMRNCIQCCMFRQDAVLDSIVFSIGPHDLENEDSYRTRGSQRCTESHIAADLEIGLIVINFAMWARPSMEHRGSVGLWTTPSWVGGSESLAVRPSWETCQSDMVCSPRRGPRNGKCDQLCTQLCVSDIARGCAMTDLCPFHMPDR